MTATFELETAQLSPGSYMAFDRDTPAYELQQREYPENRDTYYRVMNAITTLHAETLAESARVDHTQYMADEARHADTLYGSAVKAASRIQHPVETDLGLGQGRTLQEYTEMKVKAVDLTGPHIWSGKLDQTGKRVARNITFDNLARFDGHPRPRFTPLAHEPIRQTTPARQVGVEAETKRAALEALIGSIMCGNQWWGVAKEWIGNKLPRFAGAKNPIGSIALSR